MLQLLKLILMNQTGSAGFMGGGESDGTPNSGDTNGDSNTDNSGAPQGGVDPASLEPNTGNIKYPESLDKEYYGNPTLLRHVDKETGEFKIGDVMKSLVHATSMVGRDKMIVPHKDFTDDQWRETFHKLGLPKDVKEYSVENKVEEGLLADEKMFEGFKQVAHEAGILPKQAQKVLDFYNTAVKESAEQAQREAQESLEKGITELRKEWGADFDRNIGVADHSLKEFASEEEITELHEMGVLNNPILTKIFAKIGNAIADDKFVGTVSGSLGRSTEEIQAEINSYYEKGHPFMNSSHPQHQYYEDKMIKMLEAIHGKK